MGEKGSVTGRGGSGLLTAGIVIAVVIAAGTYMNTRSTPPLSEEDLAAVVPAGTQDSVQPAGTQDSVQPAGTQDSVEPADLEGDVALASTAGQGEPSSTPVEVAESKPSATADETVDATAQDAENKPVTVEAAEATDTEPAQSAPALDANLNTAEQGASEPQAPVVDQAPSIDEVRVESDGVAVIAGRAAPGSDVEVVVDGDVVATTRADSSGAFAALGTVDPADGPRVLSLRATQDEESVVSRNEVIIAPIKAPVVEPAVEPAGPIEQEAETVAESAADAPSGASGIAQEQPGAGESVASEALAETADAPDAPTEDVTADTTTSTTEVVPDVAAPQIALLQSDEEGVTLLQTAPAPPSRVVLDTIGYSDSGVVQLAGRANQEAAEVRIYLDNRAVISLPVDTAGSWRGAVPDIDAGVYTLRVDAVTAGGAVSSRIETPFKREEPEVLARAADGQNGTVRAITVQTGDTLWAIARERYGEGILYVRVFEANRRDIRDPDLIYPGQVFDLPGD